MATTIMPAYDEPIDPEFDVELFRSLVRDDLYIVQKDLDKAGEVDTASYYEGITEGLKMVLNHICKKDVRLFVEGMSEILSVTESEAQNRAHYSQATHIYYFA